jgi:hypothetical protein
MLVQPDSGSSKSCGYSSGCGEDTRNKTEAIEKNINMANEPNTIFKFDFFILPLLYS